jgi:putative MATE family efflux protein
MDKNYDKKKVHKDIYKLAWPSITEQLLIMMVGMVSTIFVGRIGKETMAAVGMVNMLMFFFQTVFSGLATGSTVVIARVIGEGERHKAKIALIQSLFMSLVAGVAITVFGYAVASPMIKLFFYSAEPEVFDIALKFYRMVLIGLPFMVLDMVIAGSLRGAGDTKTPMYVTIIVNIINLILSSILIFGVKFDGRILVPAYGVVGTAIAVNSARISGGLIRVLVLYLGKGKLSLSRKDKYTLDKDMMKRIVNVGLPAFLEQVIMQGGFLIMQVLVVSMGTVAAAVYQVGVNVNSLAFMPIFGFAIAATTMVGQNLGKGNYNQAEVYAYETNKIATVIITILGLLMFIFAKPLAMLYSNDVEVINSSITVIRIFAVLEPFLGVMNICAAVLRGAGDIKYIMYTAVVGLWLFRVAIAYSLQYWLNIGIYAVMIGICFDFGIRAIMYGFRTKAGKWKYLKV